MFVVKVPGINGKETKGCEKSGNLLIENLKNISRNESGRIIDTNLLDLEEIHLDNSNLDLTNKLIFENSFEAFELKPKSIFLGGDGSISYSISSAFLKHCNMNDKEFCLIVFDAFADVQSGSKFPTNRNWIRKLIDSGFSGENIFIVGARNMSFDEVTFLKSKNIKVMSINSLVSNLEDSCDTLMEFAKGREFYLSLDMSVLDPAFAPAVSISEPGGLTSRQMIYLLQRLNMIRTLRAVDIVEINSLKEGETMTLKLGAKILSEVI